MRHHAVDERHGLSETLRRVGPDARTLCGEWTTATLAAHLVLRERSVVELGGRLPIASLQRRAEQVVAELAEREPFDRLVDTFDHGPSWRDVTAPVPVAWFWSLPPVTEFANLLEYLVHHEDVLRAQPGWEPRLLPLDVQVVVWKRLHLLARATLRSVPVGVELVWPSQGSFRARRGTPSVTVTGNPVELAMFAFGRLPQSLVDYDGAEDDIAAVRAADISL